MNNDCIDNEKLRQMKKGNFLIIAIAILIPILVVAALSN